MVLHFKLLLYLNFFLKLTQFHHLTTAQRPLQSIWAIICETESVTKWVGMTKSVTVRDSVHFTLIFRLKSKNYLQIIETLFSPCYPHFLIGRFFFQTLSPQVDFVIWFAVISLWTPFQPCWLLRRYGILSTINELLMSPCIDHTGNNYKVPVWLGLPVKES